MIVEAEPVEVGGSANAFVALREVEQGEAIGRPGQAEPHLEGLPDGVEGAAVEAVVESGGEVAVGDARPEPYGLLLQAVDGCGFASAVVAVDDAPLAVGLLYGEVGVGKFKDAESGGVARLELAAVEFDGGGGEWSLHPLGEGVAGLLEVVGLEGFEAQVARPFAERPHGGVGIVIPLPLQSELLAAEFVGGGRRQGFRCFSGGRLGVGDGVAAVDAGNGPAVGPRDGLQVNDASDGAAVLHDHHPPVSVFKLYHAGLVQSVAGIGGVVLEDDL